MAIKLFRSSDVGAPQLSNTTAGDLINIMRGCLVEGYGTRTSAGWTMPFSDLPNKKACFKSVTGDTIRVDDSTDYRFAAVLGFASMSDVDTGVEQYPDDGQMGTGNHYRVQKRENNQISVDQWAMVTSDNWFYWIGFHDSTSPSYACGFFFGDYECSNPSFIHNKLLTGYMTNITSTSISSNEDSLYEDDKKWYCRRNYQGSIKPEPILQKFFSRSMLQPNPFTGSLDFERTFLASESTPHVNYGRLPNMFRLMDSNNSGYRGGEIFEIDTKKYMMIAHSTSAFAIEYEQSDS